LAGKVTAGLAESNGSLPPGGWLKVTCELTADQDQLWLNALKRIWEKFTFTLHKTYTEIKTNQTRASGKLLS